MPKITLGDKVRNSFMRFIQLSGVVLVLVIAYFILIYPAAKQAFLSRYVPVSESSAVSYGYGGGVAPMPMMDKTLVRDSGIVPPGQGGESFQVKGTYEQQIIKTANLDIKVVSVSDSLKKVQAIAEAVGGFTQNASSSEDQVGNLMGNVTVRVPDKSFSQSIDKIKAIATRVVSENISGQDVTQQSVDLKAQLDSLVKIKAQYEELLKQAKKVDEILQVQDRLNSTQQQIDYLQSQITYLTNQTSYSTIYVNMTEEKQITVPTNKFDLGEQFKNGVRTAITILQNFLSFIVILFFTLLGLIPYLLIIWLLYKGGRWIYVKMARRKR